MSEQAAIWFDGQESTRHPAQVALVSGHLRLQVIGQGERAYALASLRLGPRWQRGLVAVGLPDGGTLWLQRRKAPSGAASGANGLIDELQSAIGRPGWVDRCLSSWRAAVAATVAVVCLLVWLDRQGMGWAASALVQHLPASWDQQLSQRLLKVLDSKQLQVSAIPAARQRAVEQRLREAAAHVMAGQPITLLWRQRKGRIETLNAFALPDGTVVVFDGLVNLLNDDELLAVLGHELGHVRHRHGLRSMATAVGLGAVSQLVLGDFSSNLAAVAGGLQALHYSRDFEREADAFVPEFLRAAGVESSAEADMWRKFADELKRRDGGEPPAWLSTHPSMAERIKTASERR